MEARYLKEQLEVMLGGVEIFLDFDNLVVSFGLPFPFRCEAIVAQRHAWGGGAVREARIRGV